LRRRRNRRRRRRRNRNRNRRRIRRRFNLCGVFVLIKPPTVTVLISGVATHPRAAPRSPMERDTPWRRVEGVGVRD